MKTKVRVAGFDWQPHVDAGNADCVVPEPRVVGVAEGRDRFSGALAWTATRL